MTLLYVLACIDKPHTQDTSVSPVFSTDPLYCLPQENTQSRILYGHVGDINTNGEELPTGVEAVAVTDALVWSCINDTSVYSDAEGKFQLSVPDQRFVALHVHKDGYIPARWVVSPWYDGEEDVVGKIYSNTIITHNFATEIFAGIDQVYDANKTLVVVDVINPTIHSEQSGSDLLGAEVTLSASISMNLVMDDDSRLLVEGNTLSRNSDVIFLNVEPGPFTITVNTPDASVCAHPEHLYARPGELLHVSMYCQ